MSSKATKGDQNSQSPNENKTGNIIYRRIKHQSQSGYQRCLKAFLVSIMSKRGPSMRELHLDYSIDCPVYLA